MQLFINRCLLFVRKLVYRRQNKSKQQKPEKREVRAPQSDIKYLPHKPLRNRKHTVLIRPITMWSVQFK